MRKIATILFFIGWKIVCSQSQQYFNDLIARGHDTTQINNMNEYALWLENTSIDSAKKYYELAGLSSKKINYKAGIYKYYSNISYILNLKGNYLDGLTKNLEAISFAQKNKDTARLADYYFNTGSSYNNLGEYAIALDYYLNAEKLFLRLNDYKALITVYNNIGGVFSNSKQFERAIQYYYSALNYSKNNKDSSNLCKVYLNISNTQAQANKSKDALSNAENAEQLLLKKSNTFLNAYLYFTKAEIYRGLKDFDKAIYFAHQSILISDEIQSKYTIAEGLKSLSKSYIDKRNKDSALYYSRKFLTILENNSSSAEKMEAYLLLSKAEQLAQNYQSALTYEKKYWSEYSKREELKMKVKMNELENKFIQTENENKILQLQRVEQKKNQFILYLALALLTLILVSAITLFLINVKRKQIEKENLFQQSEIKQLKSEQQLLAANAVLKGQEEERLRIAKDLHDGLGGLLSGIKLTLLGIKSAEGDSQHKAITQLDNAINEMRRLSHSMMPEALNKFGLIDAINDACTTISNSGSIKVNFQAIGVDERLEKNVETNLYRVILELLNNTIKHANANEVFIQILKQNKNLSVTYEDNGVGFDVGKTTKGIGLENILWRVKLLNGAIDIQSAFNKGVNINLELEV